MAQQEMHDKILAMVREYCDTYHQPQPFHEGDRIPYESRVYDHEEMCNLVDSALEFWLTSGRYVEAFEKGFSEYLGVKFCSVVNSGSSANLLAFMTLRQARIHIDWGGKPYRKREVMVPDHHIPVLPGWKAEVALADGLARMD